METVEFERESYCKVLNGGNNGGQSFITTTIS